MPFRRTLCVGLWCERAPPLSVDRDTIGTQQACSTASGHCILSAGVSEYAFRPARHLDGWARESCPPPCLPAAFLQIPASPEHSSTGRKFTPSQPGLGGGGFGVASCRLQVPNAKIWSPIALGLALRAAQVPYRKLRWHRQVVHHGRGLEQAASELLQNHGCIVCPAVVCFLPLRSGLAAHLNESIISSSQHF